MVTRELVHAVRGAGGELYAWTVDDRAEIVRLALAKGAKPEDRLMVSVAQKGDLEAIQFLLSIGVRPGAADSATLCADALPGLLDSDCSALVKLLSAVSRVPLPPGVP